MKSKIVFEQCDSLTTKGRSYLVKSLTNRTEPKIGDSLTEKQVQDLIAEGRGELTVEVKEKRK